MRKHLKIISFIFLNLFFVTQINAASDMNIDAANTNAQLGIGYLKKGFYPLAKKRLLTSISEDDQLAVGWYGMGLYFEKTGDKQAAEIYYQRAIAAEPQSGEARNNYGTFLCRDGRYQAGIDQFLKAVNDTKYLEVASAYENAGICALMMKNQSLAMKYFHEALENNPSLSFSLLSMARLSYQSHDLIAANRYFSYFEKLELYNKPQNVVDRYRRYVFSASQSAEIPKPAG